jgi:hypothetical protein
MSVVLASGPNSTPEVSRRWTAEILNHVVDADVWLSRADSQTGEMTVVMIVNLETVRGIRVVVSVEVIQVGINDHIP